MTHDPGHRYTFGTTGRSDPGWGTWVDGKRVKDQQPETPTVPDLMLALEKSLRRAREGFGMSSFERCRSSASTTGGCVRDCGAACEWAASKPLTLTEFLAGVVSDVVG